jgi:hypothetical protein
MRAGEVDDIAQKMSQQKARLDLSGAFGTVNNHGDFLFFAHDNTPASFLPPG